MDATSDYLLVGVDHMLNPVRIGDKLAITAPNGYTASGEVITQCTNGEHVIVQIDNQHYFAKLDDSFKI